MFSHIAEETTRLTHGFLGALFSIILVMSGTAFELVAILCFGLYVIFVFNTSLFMLCTRAIEKGRAEYFIFGILIAFIMAVMICCLILAFCFGIGIRSDIFNTPPMSQIRFGLVVYALFFISLNFSHFVEIFQLAKARNAQPINQGA